MLSTPRVVHTRAWGEADRRPAGEPDPTRQREEVEAVAGPQDLADGEVTGDEVPTTAATVPRRTRWCKRRG
jgi:hypothetical protein